jgi:hypothetical protein
VLGAWLGSVCYCGARFCASLVLFKVMVKRQLDCV